MSLPGRFRDKQTYQEMTLKLGKTSVLLLIGGVIVIAFLSLGTARVQQVNKQKQLAGELDIIQRRLDTVQIETLLAQRDELEEQLARAIPMLEEAKAAISQSSGSIDVIESLFEIAEDASVDITNLSSLDTGTDKLAGIVYTVTHFTMKVAGEELNLIDFISRLNSDLSNSVVRSAEMNIPEPELGGKSLANIHLLIYGYQGE